VPTSIPVSRDYRQYLEFRFEALEELILAGRTADKEAIAAALTSVKEATAAALMAVKEATADKANSVEKRLEGMNEFRSSLSDQASRLMPRVEAEQRIGSLSDKLNENTSTHATRIGEIVSRLDRMEGRGSGINAGWGYLVGLIGLLAIVSRFLGGP
jgi:hypothetical protein